MRNRTIAAATVAASLVAGALAGAAFGTPALAGATETATGAVSWVQDALRGLVDDDTITQEQADRVETALEEARPAHRFGHRGVGVHVALSVVAESLDLTEDEVRTALEDGRSIADLAGEQGVETQVVVDAIVGAQREHLEEQVASDGLTQEQADEMLAGAEDRATALVNSEPPVMGGGPHGDLGERHGHGGPHAMSAP